VIPRLVGWLFDFSRLLWLALRETFPILRELARTFLKWLRRCFRKRRLSERDRRRARSRCVPINEPAYARPDPMIYCQTYLMSLDLGVTWDNPDIQLYENGNAIPSSRLTPNTEYEIVARIWNNSRDAPVVGLPVQFSYLAFGVGTQHYPIADTPVTLGVRGGPNHPAFASVRWRTPPVAGHYCIQALVDWLDDANPNNNLGQENTTVAQLQSPAEVRFALRNTTHERLHYRFEADTYQPTDRPPCAEVVHDLGTIENTSLGERVVAEHARERYPLPPEWKIDTEPPSPDLESGSEEEIRVVVTAPGSFRGRQPINLNAFHRYGLAGGVTIYVEGS
jgi:hypothetical protein